MDEISGHSDISLVPRRIKSTVRAGDFLAVLCPIDQLKERPVDKEGKYPPGPHEGIEEGCGQEGEENKAKEMASQKTRTLAQGPFATAEGAKKPDCRIFKLKRPSFQCLHSIYSKGGRAPKG